MSGRVTRNRTNNGANTIRRSLRLTRLAHHRNRNPPSHEMTNPRRNDSRQFMFIDQDADRSRSSEAIRVHVMRESHRARRQLRGLMRSTEAHGQITMFPVEPIRPAVLGRSESTDSVEPSPNTDQEVIDRHQQAESADISELYTLAQERLSQILTSTSPRISAVSYGIRVLQSLSQDIVDLCDSDSAALHAALALITSVQSSVNTLQAAEYESSALELLRSRLAHTTTSEHSDETITTVLLLSKLERTRLNDEIAGYHEAALLRMTQARGGIEALVASNEVLGMLLRESIFGNRS